MYAAVKGASAMRRIYYNIASLYSYHIIGELVRIASWSAPNSINGRICFSFLLAVLRWLHTADEVLYLSDT